MFTRIRCRGGPLWPPLLLSLELISEEAATEGRPYNEFYKDAKE